MKVTTVLKRNKHTPLIMFIQSNYMYSGTARISSVYKRISIKDTGPTAVSMTYNREMGSDEDFEDSITWVRQMGYMLE